MSTKVDRNAFWGYNWSVLVYRHAIMKHLTKHLQKHLKINENAYKKTWVTLVMIFFAMVMIFQKDATNTQLQFVRNADEQFVHNAAQQRDYLFQDEWNQEVYQWELTPNSTASTIAPTQPSQTDTIDSLINPNEVQQIVWDTTGQIYTGTIYSWAIATGSLTTTGNNKTGSLDCSTPWKEEVKNHDFILAYEQRKDVNTICNIEKRVCTDGTLWWTFTQNSCREDVVYEYRKAEVISYNQKVLNIYIQPVAPINSWADFDTQGKINTTESPTNTWGTSNSPVTTQATVAQTKSWTKLSCTTPRGQKIQHGQFTKAYKAPRGFIDLPCEVEIRACINGKLKWSLSYSKCTFNNTTYTDYLTAGSPTSSTGFLFFEWIKKAVRFGR